MVGAVESASKEGRLMWVSGKPVTCGRRPTKAEGQWGLFGEGT